MASSVKPVLFRRTFQVGRKNKGPCWPPKAMASLEKDLENDGQNCAINSCVDPVSYINLSSPKTQPLESQQQKVATELTKGPLKILHHK